MLYLSEKLEDIKAMTEAIMQATDLYITKRNGGMVVFTKEEKILVEDALRYVVRKIYEHKEEEEALEAQANELVACDICGTLVPKSELETVNVAEDPDSTYPRQVCAKCKAELTEQ